MRDRIRFLLNRLNERLWVRPLGISVLSIALVFLARAADHTGLQQVLPEIAPESVHLLLTIISASMLVIATFSVASMVSAYASAGSTATPRTFSLIVADDESQNALSTFIGAFIFSVVALVAIENSYYDKAGRFALFALTVTVFAIVIVTFVRWVDSIARLGRLGSTIDKVEAATSTALKRRRRMPTLGGALAGPHQNGSISFHGGPIGYVRRVDLATLQDFAEQARVKIRVEAVPGTFSAPHRALASITDDAGTTPDIDMERIVAAFDIAESRTFDEDPRFGLVVLAEIASRALSPAVNDPGTAIDVIGRFVRLFAAWHRPLDEDERPSIEYDRVEVPDLSLDEMYMDAFYAIARDGAGTVEVAVRLQEAFAALAVLGDAAEREVALRHARLALARAEQTLEFPEDLAAVRKAASFWQ